MITCSVCGCLNDSSRATCKECGSDLSDSPDWIDYDDLDDNSNDDLNFDYSEEIGYADDSYFD